MSYCVNPNCLNPSDPLNARRRICRKCGSRLFLLGERYRVIKPLRKGGFAQTFEVDDLGKIKVIKVLHLTGFSDPEIKQKVVSLFQREALVLSRLNHSGIPKVDKDGCFAFWPKNSHEPLHCLVMEKIEGLNLQEWLKNRGNQPITPAQAVDWLKQLTEILHQVHKEQCFHRDIKPANIMLRPNGQLVLIDFGSVQELTQTYLSQQYADTAIGTPGYAPPEQLHGKSVQQSDFFALGRTFVYLLTGKHPLNFQKDAETDKLIWRNSVPDPSKLQGGFIDKLLRRSLLDLIDELMEPSWKKRPKNTQEILKRLKQIGRLPLVELATGAAIILTLVAAGTYFYITGFNGYFKFDDRSFTKGDNLSIGEEILVQDLAVAEKQAAVNAFAANKYEDAVSLLEKAWQKRHDPETLIYLNNARLISEKVPANTIAVVVPISDKSLDTSLELLRGVALAQNEFNSRRKPGERGLKILIGNDENSPTKGKQIAESLGSIQEIVAVIGHFASDVTLEAIPVFEQHQLVLISPGSTSTTLPPPGSRFFFRTVPTTQVNAYALANYLLNQAGQQTAAVYYDPNSIFSKSFKEQFGIIYLLNRGRVIKEFDLSEPFFKASTYIYQAQKEGATALVILPDANINLYTLNNSLNLIKANQGRYWIMGSNTLYSPKTLQLAGREAVERFIIAVPWHHLNSPDREFPEVAKILWGGEVSSRTALAYDAARALITALEKKPFPSRLEVQQVLADPSFRATGSTGVISFEPNGNRKELVVELVKVVPSGCSLYGFTFVPVNYPADKVKEIEEGCSKEE